ncbi:MAG: LysR substrate-binding domain-containing protein, partial [Solirubrobacterales bacterium]
EGGELRMASFPSASATLLTEAVSIFHGKYPNVRLSVAEAEPEESLPRLRGGELDLALSFDYPSVPVAAERDLDRTLVLTESMHLALPKGHRLAERQVVPLAELAEQEWLCGSRSSSCGEVVLRACREAGFEPQIGFESDDYHVMQGFIAAGLGFTLLPDVALPTLRSDLVVRATDPPAPKRRIWVETRAEGARSPATDEMLATLVQVGESFATRAERLELVA